MDRQELYLYKQTSKWTKDTVPEVSLLRHNTVRGTWEHITVTKDRLKFYELDEKDAMQEEHELSPEDSAWVIAPQQWHKIEPLSDDLKTQLEFYYTADDYFGKKYGMSATHSTVRAAEGIVSTGKALDMGCGQGRNALFLALRGLDVTVVDNSPHVVQDVVELAWVEGLPVRMFEYGSNAAHLQNDFDYIAATTVFMFPRPQPVPQIIAGMQAHTNPGGYNLAVPAVDTADFPCPMSSPFRFNEGELRGHYQDWQLVKYKEELGLVHAHNEAGNPTQFKFVTMLAKKSEQEPNGQRLSETGFSDGLSVFWRPFGVAGGKIRAWTLDKPLYPLMYCRLVLFFRRPF